MADLTPTLLHEALATLGELLLHRGAPHEIAVIGGSGLLLLGAVRRATRDVDVIALVSGGALVSANPLPEPLRDAVADVARALDLAPEWLNSAPTALFDFGLPEGFLARCQVRRFDALVVHLAGRFDQIHFKLYAAADQGPRSRHMADLRALAPLSHELLAAARWCRTQDPSPGFRVALVGALSYLGVEAGDAEL